MSTPSLKASPTAGLPTGKVPAFRGLSSTGKGVGALVFVGIGQLMLYLTTTVNPTLLPGNWGSLVTGMEFYLFSILFAFILVIGSKEPILAGGTLDQFLLRFAVGGGATYAVLWAISFANPVGPGTLLGGGSQLQWILYLGFFVAPTEELLFRAALPRNVGWVMGSVILFSVYHIPAYLLEGGTTSLSAILPNLVTVGVLGFVFWVVYEKFGLAFSIGAHFLYDVVTVGVLPLFHAFPSGLLAPV